MTLEAAFDAGRLVREARQLKRKALMEQSEIEVINHGLNFGIRRIYASLVWEIFKGRNQSE